MEHNINRFYVLNGKAYPLADTVPAEYLIDSEESLADLAETVLPGSIAYLPNYEKQWQLGANRVWEEDGYELTPSDLSDKFSIGPMDKDTEVWGHTIGDLQSDIFVTNDSIVGTLKYVSTGQLVTDWGAGNFMALQFSGEAFEKAEHIWVGMDPSVSSGLVDVLKDPDKNGIFKVTNKLQNFVAVVDYGKYKDTFIYSLKDLVLQTS